MSRKAQCFSLAGLELLCGVDGELRNDIIREILETAFEYTERINISPGPQDWDSICCFAGPVRASDNLRFSGRSSRL